MNFFENLKYYDFEVHKDIYWRVESFQWVRKIPAYDVKSAIIQFLIMMDPPHFIDWPNCFGHMVMKGEFTHRKVNFIFKQIREYEHVKSRGWTIEQFKLIKIWNRHEFVPLFEDKYNENKDQFKIKKGYRSRSILLKKK